MIDRSRFIKRWQNLGFTLDEIREFMRLEQGGSRNAIRRVMLNCNALLRALMRVFVGEL
jgi:DNA-binding transcriptional MerR regulator